MQSFQPSQAATDFLKAVTDQSDMIHVAATRHAGRAVDHNRARIDDVGDRADLDDPARLDLDDPAEREVGLEIERRGLAHRP